MVGLAACSEEYVSDLGNVVRYRIFKSVCNILRRTPAKILFQIQTSPHINCGTNPLFPHFKVVYVLYMTVDSFSLSDIC